MRTGSMAGIGCGLLMVLALAGGVRQAQADVISPALTLPSTSDSSFGFRWSFDSTEPVAAINGVLTYDPAYFNTPRIDRLPATSFFNVLGNEAAPGRFHFVIYANPTATLALNQPLVEFTFNTASNLPDGATTLTFKADPSAAADSGSASRVDGTSFGNSVTFNPITVQVHTASRDWSLYD